MSITFPDPASLQQRVQGLYQDHHGWLQGWLRRRLGDHERAADLAQDTFLRLLVTRRLPELGEGRRYLAQIARNLIIDQWRRQRIEQAYLDSIAALPVPETPTLETRAMIVETLMQIDVMLASMPRKVREAFFALAIRGPHLCADRRAPAGQRQLGAEVHAACHPGLLPGALRRMNRAADAPIAPAVVEQASHWLMLHWDGELDGEQRRRFAEWQSADPEHRRAWQRLERLQSTLAAVPSDTARQVLHELPDTHRRQTLKLLGLLLIAGGSGYLAQSQLPWREAMADLRSGTGERLQRTLADGSRLSLNSGSAVDIRFSASERRIRLLLGELLLDSGRDPASRPLIVETAAGDIQALGTCFSVLETDGGSRVDLFEGALELRPSHAAISHLRAGQRCWFSAERIGEVGNADKNTIAWNEGRLVAERMPLGHFLAELSRHRPGVLRCDPAVAGLELTGVFPLADTERVLMALQQSLPVQVHSLTRYWVTIVPA